MRKDGNKHIHANKVKKQKITCQLDNNYNSGSTTAPAIMPQENEYIHKFT
jgi:hypothetical protein